MIHGVIMAGGSGTRFWPQSRRNRPKQLLNILGDKTMIRTTVERILPVIPFDRIMVITAQSHEEEIRNELPELGAEMIVGEPLGRNTAPCIALAAHKLYKKDADGMMAVLPADHLIGNTMAFLAALADGAAVVSQEDYLLTFGIVPHRPETGYGYIRLGPSVVSGGSAAVYRVERFVEKPDRVTAEGYLASGNYMWNSGMFMWRTAAILRAFETHLPALDSAIKEILPALNTPDEAVALKEAYAKIEGISIDYGIMEKAENVACMPIDVEWNDVGSWSSLEDVWTADQRGNCTKGEVVLLDCKDCIVSSPHRVTTVIGAKDLVVVDTPDALLVCRKDRCQDVRRLQEALAERGYDHLL